MKKGRTSSRKHQHVSIVVQKEIGFKQKTTGFERWEFRHNALPECNFSDITTATRFLGKNLSLPIIISSMTGGYREALTINRQLAEVCAAKGLALGVGSQRQAMEHAQFHRSYSIVREVSKDIPVFGNIGAAEVAVMEDVKKIQHLIDLIAADGFAVHLNPLQEFLQPEGNTNFSGVLRGIERLVKALSIPVIVKEIGAGLSAAVAQRVLDAGVTYIDVAGAGGTSWAGVEIYRRKFSDSNERESMTKAFWDWGISTVDAIRDVAALRARNPSLNIIASGGIFNGIEIAKSLALGAGYAGIARPVLQALSKGGAKKVLRLVDQWEYELRGAMFLTGSKTVAELQQQELIKQ